MRFTLRRSPSLTKVDLPSFFFRFLLFDVRMWRRPECPRFTFPVPVFLKRLAAPLCVFNFGISPQNRPTVFDRQLSECKTCLVSLNLRSRRTGSCGSNLLRFFLRHGMYLRF